VSRPQVGRQKAKGKRQKAKMDCRAASPYDHADERVCIVTDPQLLPFSFCLLPFAFVRSTLCKGLLIV
jgi:hypothetical protein